MKEVAYSWTRGCWWHSLSDQLNYNFKKKSCQFFAPLIKVQSGNHRPRISVQDRTKSYLLPRSYSYFACCHFSFSARVGSLTSYEQHGNKRNWNKIPSNARKNQFYIFCKIYIKSELFFPLAKIIEGITKKKRDKWNNLWVYNWPLASDSVTFKFLFQIGTWMKLLF